MIEIFTKLRELLIRLIVKYSAAEKSYAKQVRNPDVGIPLYNYNGVLL